MTFPTIAYKATNTEILPEWKEMFEQKCATLEKYLINHEAVLCQVEFEKETAHHLGKHFRVEVNVSVNGDVFRAEATEESFEQAMATVQREMDMMLRRWRDRQDKEVIKGGRKIKEMIQTV